MKEIDFLPTRYHEQDAVRKVRVWRMAIVTAFGLAVAGAASGQYAIRSRAMANLKSIEQQHALALAKAAQIAMIERELEESEQFAELYAYLEHPWPTTRLLMQLVSKIPDSVTLSELTISSRGRRSERVSSTLVTIVDDSEDERPRAVRDLNLVKRRQSQLQTVIQISGTTRDDEALHRYVAELNEKSLFESARLDLLEAVRSESGPAHSKFLVEVRVIRGYGEKGGPTAAGMAVTSRRLHDVGEAL